MLEFTDGILPLMDKELAGMLQRMLEKQGLKFQFGAAAREAKIKDGKVVVTWKNGDKSIEEVADRVLVATGRKPVTNGLGLKEAGVELDAKGFVKVDAHFATNVPHVWAIGDVIGGLMLRTKPRKRESPRSKSWRVRLGT